MSAPCGSTENNTFLNTSNQTKSVSVYFLFVSCASQHPFKDTPTVIVFRWFRQHQNVSIPVNTMDFDLFIFFCLSPAAQDIHLQAYLHTCLVFRPTRCWISPCGQSGWAIVSLFWSAVRLCCERGVLPVQTEPLKSALLSPCERCCGSWLRFAGRRDTMRRPRPVSELPDRARSFIIIHFEN